MRLIAFTAIIIAQLSATAQERLAIQEDVLSEMVVDLQEEGATRFLSNMVQKNIKTTNYATYNTMYDCVDILLRESDKPAMKKLLIERVANYGLSFAVAHVLCARLKRDNAVAANARSLDSTALRNMKQELDTVLSMGYDHVRKTRGGKRRFLFGAKTAKNFTGGVNTLKPEELRTIDASSSYWPGVENYLMDSVYVILSRNASLKGVGLFRTTKRRVWQYDLLPIDYEDFWKSNSDQRARVDTVLSGLRRGSIKLDTLTKEIAALWGLEEFNLDSIDLKELSFKDKRSVKLFVGLFSIAADHFAMHVRQNTIIRKIAEIISEHVIFDSDLTADSPEKFDLDVEGMVLSFEDRFLGWNESPMKNSLLNVRPFFTIGLNYGYFGGPDTAFATESSLGQRQIAWAGEKIGLKWRLHDWGYTRSREAYEPYRFKGKYYVRYVRPRTPLVSNVYLMLYGSGVLYTIADLRSDSEFNQIIVGTGAGFQLFNKLELNLSYALRVDSKSLDQGFLNVGFDIPIFNYIRAVRGNGN